MNSPTSTRFTAPRQSTVLAATVLCLALFGISTAHAGATRMSQPQAPSVASLVTKQKPAPPAKSTPRPSPTAVRKPAPAAPLMSYETMYQLMLLDQQEADRQYFASIAPPAPAPEPAAPTVNLASAAAPPPVPAPQPAAYHAAAPANPAPAPAPAAEPPRDSDKGGKKEGRRGRDD